VALVDRVTPVAALYVVVWRSVLVPPPALGPVVRLELADDPPGPVADALEE